MLRVSGGGGAHGNLMLSLNLLKSKIPMSGVCVWGGGGWWNQFSTFNAESKFAKKKKNCEKFSKFSGKNWNGFVPDFEYQVVPLYAV